MKNIQKNVQNINKVNTIQINYLKEISFLLF